MTAQQYKTTIVTHHHGHNIFRYGGRFFWLGTENRYDTVDEVKRMIDAYIDAPRRNPTTTRRQVAAQ